MVGRPTGHIGSDAWVRIVAPPLEGKLVGRMPELDIGQRVQVIAIEAPSIMGH